MVDFQNLLREHGLKATPQRVAILEELGKKTHPTMDEMYHGILEKYPTVSLATVYKNVHVLKDEGVIIEINMPNGKMRYDYFSRPHIHIACKKCGSIKDMEYDENLLKYQEELEKSSGLIIDRLDVVGSTDFCQNCK